MFVLVSRAQCLRLLLVALLATTVFSVPAHGNPQVRIGDITTLAGEHENKLSGIGLVSGLAGTGGKNNTTKRALLLLLQNQQFRFTPIERERIQQLQEKTDNLSLVTVTATLPPYAKTGQKLDVTVSTLDDAASLNGGHLEFAPLLGPDGQVYAVANGPISTNGGAFNGEKASVVKNHPTVGRIPNGAVVEQEIPVSLFQHGVFRFLLRHPEAETATRIADAINLASPGAATVMDPAEIAVRLPYDQEAQPYAFVADCKKLLVEPYIPARVVINERNGTIVVGHNVRLSTVAITQGNLTVTTVENTRISQPRAFSDGQTAAEKSTDISVVEQGDSLAIVNSTTTVGELSASLNALGVTPRDLSSIFQSLKRNGSLHAEIEFQ